MKLIFLDIDGVMNHRNYMVRSRLHMMQEFCPVAVRNLREVVKRTGANIVLSSTWRKGLSIKEIKKLFSWYDLDKYVIGKTPVLDWEIRGKEIQLFMDEFKLQPIESFIILDDDDDMGKLLPHLIHCKSYSGFVSDERREQAILLLGEVPIERK
ncbi:HAD domain-containing protein [Bacillus sp. 3255]|uniref:HAD domain-containing protein n=1 Tax=Bacillus sp. 3255 TaxID=2817904 RepID=UPI00286A21E0|nr:HAD domain-containing protein [Bacillus sp. 3255]